jgi:porin
MSCTRWTSTLLFLFAMASCLGTTSHAQQSPNGDDPADLYDAPVLEGPSGVSAQLQSSAEQRKAIFDPGLSGILFNPFVEWKQQLQEDYGFSLGVNVYLLYQHSSGSLGDNDDAVGGIYRVQGSWELFDRGGKNPGLLEWRFENRSKTFNDSSPSALSKESGIAALDSGFGYTNTFDTDLAILNWTQSFLDDAGGVAVGRLTFDAYLDAFPFQTFSRGFINRSFVVNPTLATTGVGALGVVAKSFVSNNIWIGAQIYDGNAVSGEFDWDTFDQHEWLKAVEIGWSPDFERYMVDQVQLSYWRKDARKEAGVSEGEGWLLSAAYKLGDSLHPFLRLGHSDGGAGVAAEDAASVGMEWELMPDQFWSFGLGWAKPSKKTHGAGLKDEYVFETSYKLQLSPALSLTPDLQYIKDPAKNQEKSSVWVLGLRAIWRL